MGNAGQFKNGDDPRRNTSGRPFSSTVKASARSAPGSDGVIAYSGYVQSNERNSRLSGQRLYTEYANAYQHPVVAIALLLRWALGLRVKWSLQENESGSAAAKRGLEVCEQGLLKAKLPKPWNKVAAKAMNKSYFEGNSIHATGIGRRKDGTVVYTDLGHRPPHTIEQWWRKDRANQEGPFVACTQRTSDGRTTDLSLDECLYLVNDALGDSPAGDGVLRLVLERLRRVGKYEGLEGREMFTNMGGAVIARAPLEEIAGAKQGTDAQKAAHVQSVTSELRSVVADRIKTPEEQPYMLLDSATYRGTDPNNVSSIKKWDIETVDGKVQGLVEIRKTITDESLNVARVLGVEFIFIGGTQVGNYTTHESKIDMFVDTMTAQIDDVRYAADQQLLRRLCVLNGLDPDEACPSMVASPIKRADVMKAVDAIVRMQQAALEPNHPMKREVFEAFGMPYQEESEESLMLPRGLPPRPGAPDPDDETDPLSRDAGKEPEREPVNARKR